MEKSPSYFHPIKAIAYWQVRTTLPHLWVQVMFLFMWLFAIVYLFLAQLQFLVESLNLINIRDFMHWQQRGLVLLIAVLGAGLIAGDREQDGLKLYFARPLTPGQYLLGKLAAFGFYVYALVFAPTATVLLLGYVMQPEEEGRAFYEVCLGLGSGFLYAALITLVLGTFTLWVSGLSQSRRGASVLWVFLYFGSEFLYEFLTLGLSVYENFTRWMSLVALRKEVELLGSWIFYPWLPEYVPEPMVKWYWLVSIQTALVALWWFSVYRKIRGELES